MSSSTSCTLTFAVFVGFVGACLTSSACGTSNSGADDRPDGSVDAAPDAPPAPVPLREEAAIDEISVSQAVKVTLVKGGVAVAIAYELGLPVKLVGVGEALDDLRPFDPREFARALVSG